MIALIIIAIWMATGCGFYHLAATSWNRRWKDNSAPFSYVFGAMVGPVAIGFWIAELQIRSRRP